MKNKTVLNPLKIFVVWDDSFVDGLKYANMIYSLVSRPVQKPIESGISIPVDYINNNSPAIETNKNHQNLVFILLDDYFIYNKEFWNKYLNSLKLDKNVLLVPITFDEIDYSAIKALTKLHYEKMPANNITEYFNFTVAFEVSRILNRISGENEDIKLFLSHSKATGEKIVQKFKAEVDKSTKFKTFFDKNNIPAGEQFDIKIIENIQDSIVVVFLTDGFSSREWCRKEILISKEYERPIILLDFYNNGEERMFPYIGNVKVIRLDANHLRYYKIFTAILLENIRINYYKIHTEYLIKLFEINNNTFFVMKQPPELLTVLNHSEDASSYIYPEPPINLDELSLISKIKSSNNYMTPVMFATYKGQPVKQLPQNKVGISISYPNVTTLNEKLKLEDMITTIMKYLLTLEFKIYYAGSPLYKKENSFSLIFSNLEQKFKEHNVSVETQLTLLVQKQVYEKMSIKEKNNLKAHSNLVPVKSNNEENELLALRKKLIESVNIHILIGGKDKTYKGQTSGVLEEFLLSMKEKKTVYLLGGFGGVTKSISELLIDKENNSNIATPLLEQYSINDLNNGLSKNDNELLMTTKNPNIAMALILKGINKLNN